MSHPNYNPYGYSPHQISQGSSYPSGPPTQYMQNPYQNYPLDTQFPYVPHSPATDGTSHSPENSTQETNNKKKRKSTVSEDDSHETQADQKKRTKTARACDSCRSRKIRCDILIDTDPQTCKHCKQYGFECTFFLPITETRFKRKKVEDEADKVPSTPHTETVSAPDATIQGPTSAAHLLHSQGTVSSRIYEAYDVKYHHTYEISQNGSGFIQIAKPEEQTLTMPTSLDPQVERDVVEKLINAYFTEVAPEFPVVTREEFVSNPKPDPILLYSMCLVAATRRDVQLSVFEAIRYAVNTIIKAKDVLSTPTLANVQALLILYMSADCHSQFVPNALSAVWVRVGVAIRMAQDLGLHRAEASKENIELRRRVWAACIVADRWTAITFGHPYMIAVEDCDACLPCSGSPVDVYMNQLVRLSLLVGRINRTLYGPSGLNYATDEGLQALLADLEAYRERLPDLLQFHGPTSSRHAGLVHMLYTCASMLFWRVFMRISYKGPQHLSFHLTVEKWSKLDKDATEAIYWLDTHERSYDVWMAVPYSAVSCALVVYHTFVRRRDETSATTLKVLRDVLKRWESAISDEHMSCRRKTAEIVTLLYEATQNQPFPLDTSPALSPTNGVTHKDPQGSLEYRPDPTKPGSGVFIAHGSGDFSDLGPGIVIPASNDSKSQENSAKDKAQNNEDFASSAFAPPLPEGASSVTDADLIALFGGNVNPVMNSDTKSSDVQLLNALDPSNQQASQSLSQLASMDTGYLDGLPAELWNFPQWDEYFTRFNVAQAPHAVGASESSSTPHLT